MVLGRGESDNEAGFKDYLSRRQIRTEYVIRNTSGDSAQLPHIVAEIRETRPDIIYTWGTPQTLGVVGPYDAPDPTKFIRDIPVVFTFVTSPTGSKIVKDLDHPGGNATGTIHVAPISTQINTLLSYRNVSRIGVIFNPAELNSVLSINDLRAVCAEKKLTLIERPIPLVEEGRPDGRAIPALVADLSANKAEFLYVGPDTFVASVNREPLASAALANRLPTFSCTELIVRQNKALMGLVSSSFGLGQFTASKVADILLGRRSTADTPVETLHRFSLLINMQAAQELHFFPPISLINIAEVIL
jgi:putative ABC transport system substrate-binding protein